MMLICSFLLARRRRRPVQSWWRSGGSSWTGTSPGEASSRSGRLLQVAAPLPVVLFFFLLLPYPPNLLDANVRKHIVSFSRGCLSSWEGEEWGGRDPAVCPVWALSPPLPSAHILLSAAFSAFAAPPSYSYSNPVQGFSEGEREREREESGSIPTATRHTDTVSQDGGGTELHIILPVGRVDTHFATALEWVNCEQS